MRAVSPPRIELSSTLAARALRPPARAPQPPPGEAAAPCRRACCPRPACGRAPAWRARAAATLTPARAHGASSRGGAGNFDWDGRDLGRGMASPTKRAGRLPQALIGCRSSSRTTTARAASAMARIPRQGMRLGWKLCLPRAFDAHHDALPRTVGRPHCVVSGVIRRRAARACLYHANKFYEYVHVRDFIC